MFIELADYLRCPTDPTESYCVVSTDEMQGRSVISGTIGCPATGREYPIVEGIADFTSGLATPPPNRERPVADPNAVGALMGITTPGGYVVVFGSAVELVPALAETLGGVHFVGVNTPGDVDPATFMSVLRSPVPVALRSHMARGVVVGPEYAERRWLDEGVRVLLNGLRIVVLRDEVSVEGAERLAQGDGLWVGQKR